MNVGCAAASLASIPYISYTPSTSFMEKKSVSRHGQCHLGRGQGNHHCLRTIALDELLI